MRPYSSDLPDGLHIEKANQAELNVAVPVLSATCSHTLCLSCVKQQITPVQSKDDKMEESDRYVQCPVCMKESAFDAKHPTVSTALCNMIEIMNERSIAQSEGREEATTNASYSKSVDFVRDHKRLSETEIQDHNVGCKYEPDLYIFEEEPSGLKNENEYDKEFTVAFGKPSKVKAEMEANVLPHQTSATENQELPPVRPPRQPPHLPGAYAIDGPHFNSSNRVNSPLERSETSMEVLVHATLVETPPPSPEMLTAYAEPLLTFREKYKWHLRGFLICVIIVTVVSLAIEIPKIKEKNSLMSRNNMLTSIALNISNQKNTDELGVPQRSALNWILGANNVHYDPVQDRGNISQRYILATMYYSTNGENWIRKISLSPDDECMWSNSSFICSEDGSVVMVQLGESRLISIKYLSTFIIRLFPC